MNTVSFLVSVMASSSGLVRSWKISGLRVRDTSSRYQGVLLSGLAAASMRLDTVALPPVPSGLTATG